jgi:hypothetical protein
MRGIQYAAALSINHRRLWDTGSPAGACHRAALCADPLAGDDRSEEGVGVARFRFSFQTARIQTDFEIVIAGLNTCPGDPSSSKKLVPKNDGCQDQVQA